MLRLHPGAVAVPVSSSRLIESLAEKNGHVVHRLKTEPRALMEAVGSGRATFAGNDAGEFIVSKELPFPDGLLAAGKIVEFLSSTGVRINELKRRIYQPTLARGVVLVPWNERGRIMRRLAMDFGEKRVESLEGIKFLVDEGWVFINPSMDEPVFDIVAESSNIQSASSILKEFQNKVSDIVTGSDSGA
jgi:mannose-1-phosphate guanylyltransferase/phosphomannomutase